MIDNRHRAFNILIYDLLRVVDRTDKLISRKKSSFFYFDNCEIKICVICPEEKVLRTENFINLSIAFKALNINIKTSIIIIKLKDKL